MVIVLCLVFLGGCARDAQLTSQLAESVGIRSQGASDGGCIPVIYPSESSPVCGNGGAASASSGWEYGASGDLQCDEGAMACKK
ncbi:MAG: hypothetical protein BM485_03385 [Desulfobulbaceae bacterium DB1]|nr:MAG: hypothetical protein BM485_03385 [Desulfobulbaceae bacterium DB1]